ncbi:MAG: fibrobacter succinogenes major paralogous domain-containing protein [Ignavibacteriae bacterium]|nr:fibrobacter succinogenes major paralogous domain-containing protein [Ignavibacteriota bacterium]
MRKQNIVLLGIFLLTIFVLSGCNNSSDPVSPASNTAGTITIGSQVWADKNLDVSTYRNGDPIPQVQDSIAWTNLTTGAWCYYNGDAGLGTTYGKIYNWYAVNDARGLAPLGYHISTDAEWTLLTNNLGGDTIAGGKLKALTLWQAPNTGATNSSGFTALPAGFRNNIGNSYRITVDGYFWTANEYNSGEAWDRYLWNERKDINRYSLNKKYGLSVRCIKD